MPACVVVDYQMEIVQFRGTTDLFLYPPKGKATFNILKMARPEIAFELRNAIQKPLKQKRIRESGIELKINSEVKIISFEIVPLKIEWNEPLLLILFTEHEQTEVYSKLETSRKNDSPAKDRRIKSTRTAISHSTC
jgi:two-component system, chemotaxis family, CheB/CheR fusion protein